MKLNLGFLALIIAVGTSGNFVNGDETAFHEGPVFSSFGNIASVDSDVKIPDGTKFKVRFDVHEKGEPGSINRTFDSVARFINVNVEAGMPLKNIDVAIVVHGGAAVDLTLPPFYRSLNDDKENVNIPPIKQLLKNRVKIYLCGQTAAYRDITKSDLVPGVSVGHSAMTIHALLEQRGFSLNPF